jgi:PadR family transcriptional regulator PadR
MKGRDLGDPEAGDKWEVQLRKGCLELAILAALWDERRYGLSRLKAFGLVRSEWVASEAGHPRKYYALTQAGKRRAFEMAKIWARLSSSMSQLLAPLAKGE